jgi:hypothetical protein
MNLTELLLFVHIASVVCWVGGAVMFNILAMRSGKMGADPQGVLRTAEQAEWLGKVFYPPLVILTLLSGIGMVIKTGYDWEDPFVVVGIAMVITASVLGGAFYAKQTKAMVEGINERGMDERSMSILKRIVLVSNVETAFLFFVVFMMVTKVGGP